MSFVTHLESTADGSELPAGTLQTTHGNRPLLVRYDLDAVRNAVDPEKIRTRPDTLWRYRELLPLRDEANEVSLGEGMTPLLHCPRLGAALGMSRLYIKDESQLPTGSFKSRGMTVAVSMAKELGVSRVAAPTAGNAGGALAAYAARAGMECFVFMPDDTPLVNRYEAHWHGARTFLVNGLIHHCGALVREGVERMGWFDMSTMKEPYRLEGKKTMGLELAEQMGWRLPDAILYPTGGGTGLIGMWKAFAELETLGWLRNDRRPRMFSCQSSGCAPIAAAFDSGAERGAEVENPHTLASGLRVPKAFADFMILEAVRESGGRAMAASEDRLREWMRQVMSLEGIALCPESALCIGVLETCLEAGHIEADEEVVLFNTGATQKYVEVLETSIPSVDRHAVDWESLAG
jgi:threonine synthase